MAIHKMRKNDIQFPTCLFYEFEAISTRFFLLDGMLFSVASAFPK